MSIKLINQNERLTYEIDGSVFIYRRVLPNDWNEMKKKHTKRGYIDFMSAGFELLETHIIDWKNVTDTNGKEIKFNPDLVRMLPDPVCAELVEAINGTYPGQGAQVIEERSAEKKL